MLAAWRDFTVYMGIEIPLWVWYQFIRQKYFSIKGTLAKSFNFIIISLFYDISFNFKRGVLLLVFVNFACGTVRGVLAQSFEKSCIKAIGFDFVDCL